MDELTFFLFALAAFVSGFSGFAMGLVVSGVWLHIITPVQTATLIAGYGLLTQGYGIFKLRHTLDLRKAWPLTAGTIIGIPIGVSILTYLNPGYLRSGCGVLLVLYAIYGLTRPVFAPMKIGVGADVAIGLSNGLLGGLTGLGGVIDMKRRWAQWLDGCLAKTESIRMASGKGCNSAARVESRMKRSVSRTYGQSGVK